MTYQQLTIELPYYIQHLNKGFILSPTDIPINLLDVPIFRVDCTESPLPMLFPTEREANAYANSIDGDREIGSDSPEVETTSLRRELSADD